MEKERLVHGRYLLQRPLAQGQICAVFKGFDQVLQRAVVVKIVPTPYIAPYRDAMKLTAEFSHPNIIGIYDLLEEPETLYIVQEYVEGDVFGAMLQTQLAPYQVTDVGTQICHALLYATVREVIHGDLTPSAVIRDKRGLVRLNNFALPSNRDYFTAWSIVGGDSEVLSDRELPWGKVSNGRRADDVRAVGLLLYQLLAGRTPGATSVEPPVDGRLRFLRNVPVELCELIARAVVRQHPQRFMTVEPLYDALQQLAEKMEPQEGASNLYQTDDMAKFNAAPVATAGTDRLVTALPTREGNPSSMLGYRNDVSLSPGMGYPQSAGSPVSAVAPVATSADPAVRLVSAQDVYAEQPASPFPQLPQQQGYQETQSHRLSLPMLITLGVILFVLFFVVGYFVAHVAFP